MVSTFGPLNIIKPLSGYHTGTVLFFHGSGDTGRGIRQWVKFLLGNDMAFNQIQVVYPTAPLRPYTPMGGEQSNVWFDRLGINPDVPEHKESLDYIGDEMTKYIKLEVAKGISLNRIIIGGFSMGGCLSLHLAFRYIPEVAGVFALSSFLNKNSLVYNELEAVNDNRLNIPLFMCHGDRDDLVPIEWGENTYQNLLNLGIKAQFNQIKNTQHELKKDEMKKLSEWILKVLPPI